MSTKTKALAVLILALVFMAVGCVIVVEPDIEQLRIVLWPGESQRFEVEDPGDSWKVYWELDGVPVAEGLSYIRTAEENPGTEMLLHTLTALTRRRAALRWLPPFSEPRDRWSWRINVPAPGGPELCYRDWDGDGFGNEYDIVQSDNPPDDCVAAKGDCRERDEKIHPGAEEICNGMDDNCNGQYDEGLELITSYRDADGDGFGDPNASYQKCEVPSFCVLNSKDCDDTNAAIGECGALP